MNCPDDTPPQVREVLERVEADMQDVLDGYVIKPMAEAPWLVAYIRQRIEESLDVTVHDMIVDGSDPYNIKVQAACVPNDMRIEISFATAE